MATQKKTNPFRFKQFEIRQDHCPMKVGTDGILLGAWTRSHPADRILDIGTGTGVIAIMLGQRNGEALIEGVEIDPESSAEARLNMEAAPWSDRLKVIQTSIQEHARQTDHRYDLIVSNPPFFTGGTFSDKASRASVRHTTKLPHGDLLQAVRRLLSDRGRFSLILPYLEGLRFSELARTYQLYVVRSRAVRPTPDKPIERLLLELEGKPGRVEEEPELIIQFKKEGGEEYSEAFQELTHSFYLHM